MDPYGVFIVGELRIRFGVFLHLFFADGVFSRKPLPLIEVLRKFD